MNLFDLLDRGDVEKLRSNFHHMRNTKDNPIEKTYGKIRFEIWTEPASPVWKVAMLVGAKAYLPGGEVRQLFTSVEEAHHWIGRWGIRA